VREKYCWLVADKPSEQGVKFLGCQLAQRVHGSKVEANESTENSKELNWTS
jgi:hypothetical protein